MIPQPDSSGVELATVEFEMSLEDHVSLGELPLAADRPPLIPKDLCPFLMEIMDLDEFACRGFNVSGIQIGLQDPLPRFRFFRGCQVVRGVGLGVRVGGLVAVAVAGIGVLVAGTAVAVGAVVAHARWQASITGSITELVQKFPYAFVLLVNVRIGKSLVDNMIHPEL